MSSDRCGCAAKLECSLPNLGAFAEFHRTKAPRFFEHEPPDPPPLAFSPGPRNREELEHLNALTREVS